MNRESESRMLMRNPEAQEVPLNPANQHGFPQDPAASRTAPNADRETSASPVVATGAAFHPEIIAKSRQCKVLSTIRKLDGAPEPVPTNAGKCARHHPLLGHYCNVNRCHCLSAADLEVSYQLIAALEPGVHDGICGPHFSCITERKGDDGVVITITCQGKLFALLGVALTDESSSLVWDWLQAQYEVLRRASYQVNFRGKADDLKLRREGIIGDTYYECASPTAPARCPWFSYIVNSDVFHDHLLYYPEDTQILGSLAYGWFERQAARNGQEQGNRLEFAA